MIAIPLALVAATAGAFLFFGLTAIQEAGPSTNATETTATANVAGGRLVLAVHPKQEREFEIFSHVESGDGDTDATLIEPNISMTMIGHDMGRSLIPMYRQSDGTWRGEGSFSMQGQWRFRVIFDEETIEIDHIAQ